MEHSATHTGIEQISVGVVGTGGMGGMHAENLHSRVVGARVAAVADLDTARAGRIAERCGAAVFQDAVEMIRDDSVEAVVIASPDESHAGLTLECLRNRKPVLCEKPLAISPAEAREVVDAEGDLGQKLVQGGFMRRYDPQHVDVKETVASGAIGPPVLFKGLHRNPELSTGATSESVVVNSAIHDLDSARWLLGQEIEEVYARGVNTARTPDGPFDLQLIQLSMSGGCLGIIEVYVDAGYGYEVAAEIVGGQGTVHTAPPDGAVVRRDHASSQRLENDWLERFRTAYIVELQHWVEALGGGQPTGPDAWDGYVSLVAAEVCAASLREGLPQRMPATERPALYAERLEVIR